MKLEYILYNINYFLGFEKTYHKQALYRLFDECNQRYFGGKLPKIKILVNNDMDNIWGQMLVNINVIEAKFTPLNIFINLKGIGDNNKDLLNVMVHEMVHCWEYCIGGTSTKNWANAWIIWLTELRDVDFSNNPTKYEEIWNKIKIELGHGTDDIHSEMFMQKCHELNEKFPELELKVSFNSSKL